MASAPFSEEDIMEEELEEGIMEAIVDKRYHFVLDHKSFYTTSLANAAIKLLPLQIS